jgi:hypothetical protein
MYIPYRIVVACIPIIIFFCPTSHSCKADQRRTRWLELDMWDFIGKTIYSIKLWGFVLEHGGVQKTRNMPDVDASLLTVACTGVEL